MAYLTMHRGPTPGKVYTLEGQEITIGRGSKNSIIVHDNEVSREHARFVQVPGGFELYDLASSNGTFVNGQMVDTMWLLNQQCIIELGDSITFEYNPGNPDDPVEDTQNIAAASMSQIYLVVNTESQDEPAVYPLDGMVVRVGRATSADIVVIEPEISREHFVLSLGSGGYSIQDIGSTNGTMVNGEQLTGPRLITMEDIIQIGKTITFQLTDKPEVYANLIRTSLLVDTRELSEKATDLSKQKPRITQTHPDIPAIISPVQPTSVGTGIDVSTLSDQILLSYARSEWHTVVAPLVDNLYDADIGVWVDQYLTEGSSDWLVATEKARLECWLLVVVVSTEAMRSELVKRNWRHFHNREKPILLLIYEPVERMPIGADKLVRVDYNPAIPDVAFNRLVEEVKKRDKPATDDPKADTPESDEASPDTPVTDKPKPEDE